MGRPAGEAFWTGTMDFHVGDIQPSLFPRVPKLVKMHRDVHNNDDNMYIHQRPLKISAKRLYARWSFLRPEKAMRGPGPSSMLV